MSYVIIERNRDGSTRITRRLDDGQRELLAHEPANRKVGPTGGWWQMSDSNGIVADAKTLRQHQAKDAKLGVPIHYECVKKKANGVGLYKACFASAAQKRSWLKANKRVDFDAGYRDPCPGDFRGQFPGEFDQ